MKKIALIAISISATACVGPSATETYTPSGKIGYSITCNGTARTWGSCLELAGEKCGAKGYNVLSSSKDTGYVSTKDFSGSTKNRSMLIECKE